MYMAPITRAPHTRTTRAPSTATPRRLVGVAVLLAAAPVMAGWLAVQGVVALVVLGARTALQAIDYAGTVALGR